jgi:type II secretory pathway pseudopilin PulG
VKIHGKKSFGSWASAARPVGRRSTLLATRYPLPATSSGFTLVELLIGASLSAAVLAAVLSSYIYLGRSLARLANQQALETQARRAIGYFTQDVQQATGLVTLSTAPASPAANRVDLTIPTATGATNTVTYYYNSDLTDSAVVTINLTAVTMPAASLTRCVDNGTTVTSITLLRNITDGDTAENDNDLLFRFFDASGNEYETATLAARSYLPGIKLVSLEFAAQIQTVNAGTSTPVQREATARLALRNRGFLQ